MRMFIDNYVNLCIPHKPARIPIPAKDTNMADDDDFISTDHQFLIEYYWEELVKRINISKSTLIDLLLGNEILTQQEGEDLKVFIYIMNEALFFCDLYNKRLFN